MNYRVLTPTEEGLASLYTRGTKIYLRLPDKLKLGRNRFLSLKLPHNSLGKSRAQEILYIVNRDIIYEDFDNTFKKYKSLYERKAYQERMEKINRSFKSLQQLWSEYCTYKKDKVKAYTLFYLTVTIGSKINKINEQDITKAREICNELLKETTPAYTLRVIKKISALYEWCLEEEILEWDENPYKKIVKELKDRGDTTKEPEPNPLPLEEIEDIFSKLQPQYLPLLNFVLLCGCRPGEAVGLRWKNVHDTYLVLGCSRREKEGQVFESETSKNNKTRKFPMTEEIKKLLNKQKPGKPEDYVFNHKQEPIDYNSLYNNWRRVTKRKSTPYCCRDTFISTQVRKGVPVAVVAKWVDNSVRVIEKHYLDVGLELKPK